MTSFAEASRVEIEGMTRLWPYIKALGGQDAAIKTNTGTLSECLQANFGDAFVAGENNSCWGIEVKVEEKHTGNLFIETYSNRNLQERKSHALRGITMGWVYKLRGDRLLYYFLDTDDLYNIDVFSLKRWAFVRGRLFSFNEVPQGKYSQLNDTWGRLVPVSILERELGHPAFEHVKLSSALHLEAAE